VFEIESRSKNLNPKRKKMEERNNDAHGQVLLATSTSIVVKPTNYLTEYIDEEKLK
jgi:hypothetical protein